MIAEALSAEEVSDAACRWLEARFGGVVAPSGPAARLMGGADFWTYAVAFVGDTLPSEWRQPLVARVPPLAERFTMLERENRLQTWAADQGYSAPAIVDLRPPGEVFERPVQFVRRVPGTTMSAAMTAAPWRVGSLVDRLARLLVQLHEVPVPAWAAGGGWSVIDRRLALVRFVVSEQSHRELEAGLDSVTSLLPRLEVEDPVVCHGDFHPLNVLVDGTRAAVIDWTDAGIGDAHCDIARTAWLFRFAAVASPRRAERLILSMLAPWLSRRFRHAYEKQHAVDENRIRLWMPLHLLHGLAMTVASEHETFGPSRSGVEFSRDLQPWLRMELEKALARV